MKTRIKKYALSAALLISIPSQACFFDGMFTSPFAESFPGSLSVAVATQNALKTEQIAKVDPIEGVRGLQRVSWWLTVMQKDKVLDLSDVDYIFMVDSQLWSKVEDNGLSIHTGPEEGEGGQVLMMTESSLSALVQKEIDYQVAVDLGIIKVSEKESTATGTQTADLGKRDIQS